MDLKECKEKRIIRTIKPDPDMAESLIRNSDNKINTAKEIPINNTSSTSIITLFYDALREKLEALALNKGFKILNHECYYSFLKETLQKEMIAKEFDRFRKIRNNINYYGEIISLSDTKEIKKDILTLIKNIEKIN
ncbi:MAG: hypothetical protein ABIB43_01285 [archaeon]